MRQVFKPSHSAFVTWHVLKNAIFIVLLSGIITSLAGFFIAASKPDWLVAFLIFMAVSTVLIILLNWMLRTIIYKKEEYIIDDDRVYHRSGSLFSDQTTELNIRNITHVTMLVPYIEHRLFKTGTISIQSAGSGAAEVVLESVNKPDTLYEAVQTAMRKKGFGLKGKKLIQEEQPSTIGILLGIIPSFLGQVLAGLAILFGILIPFTASTQQTGIFIILLIIFILGYIAIVTGLAILRYLNQKKRQYQLYDDMITYKEGFLTRNYSVIPLENLADTSIKQGFIGRLLGIYDVHISCQGAGQEIIFSNMERGDILEKNLDTLIEKTESLIVKGKKEKASSNRVTKKEVRKETAKSTYTAHFTPDMKTTLMSYIIVLPVFIVLFPLLPIYFIALIVTIITALLTKYRVKPTSFESYFDIGARTTTTFSAEKITAIILNEGPVQRWYHTLRIQFWSIGASSILSFLNIPWSKNIKKEFLKKIGIEEGPTRYTIHSNFKVSAFFKATLYLTLFLLAGITVLLFLNVLLAAGGIAILAALYIIGIVYAIIYYKTVSLTFHKNYVHYEHGIWWKQYYYVKYHDIKDITIVQYPFSSRGKIEFNVAGETETQDGKGNKKVVAHSLKIHYVDNIHQKDELIDRILIEHPNAQRIQEIENNIEHYSPPPILKDKPSLGNSVTILLLVSAIFFPLLILLPITLPLTILTVKMKTAVIQPYRVYLKSGILFKRQKSVVFSKIDHISIGQGAFNKMFHNGTITVNTIGSSEPELVIANIPRYKEFSEELNKHY
ncbi:PH domain-containing protein [Candidatus Woesearchaeota archaeon]|nr:PH domain-containing protein [Candidatus Woesearchaeota archaeon]